MAAPSARIQTLVNSYLVPGAVDSAINHSPVTSRTIGNARKWNGVQLERAVKYQATGLGGTFSGLEEFSTEDVATSIKLTYYLGAYEQPVVVPGIEKLLNSVSDTTATSLVGYKVEEAKIELADGVAQLFFGNSDAEINSFRDFADDGGQTASIGGQSRTTYSALQGTDTASGGTISLTKIRTLMTATGSVSTVGARPTLAPTTETIWDLVESLMTPTVQANYEANGYPQVTMTSRAPVRNTEFTGIQGFASVVYAGLPIVGDERCTSQTFYEINEDKLDWYGAKDPDLMAVDLGDTKDLESVYHKAPSKFHGFNWQPLMRPINQYGEVGHIYLFGQLVSWEPRRQGCLTGVTGV
jgi:hypothetical protein